MVTGPGGRQWGSVKQRNKGIQYTSKASSYNDYIPKQCKKCKRIFYVRYHDWPKIEYCSHH